MITVIIIGYNSSPYLNKCLQSLTSQTITIDQVIYIDNNSSDNSIEYIETHYPQFRIVKNSINFGYARAANQGIDLAAGDYVLILNPDMILEPDYLSNALIAFTNKSKIAAVTGKIYKYDFTNNRKTQIIDTVGIVALKGRRFLDNGAGIEDVGQFEKSTEIFGVAGNCALFYKKALIDIKIDKEYFDEDFFMYKEDIDLCWRLRLFGWKCFFTPDAIAYHGRGTGITNRRIFKESINARKRLNNFQKYYSFKNHRLMLIKNELCATFFRNFFSITTREISMLIWICIFEPNTYKVLMELFKQLKPILKKRHIIMNKKRISYKEIMPWLRGKGEEM